MEIKHLSAKIIKHYNKADDTGMESGLTWYNRAHNECVLLSQVFEIPLSKAVGVVAALSPNNKWKRNLHDAWQFLDSPSLETKVCTFKTQRQKALDILSSDGSDATILKILNGQKTKNFYENIKYYASSERVTVDMWAFRSVDLRASTKNFKLVELAYKEAATELDLRPHQLQAVIWGVVRGEYA